MKYLFFDIECANCFNGIGKICEFGYVITDESFNEIGRDLLIINPRTEFDWYVAKKMLAYNLATYRAAQDYCHYFDQIKELFVNKDIMVFGHTTESDIKYLNDEARRYGLQYFTCNFYDAKFMYNTFAGLSSKSFGVAKICDELGISRPKHEHRSVDDAYATMLIVKEICSRMNISVIELIERCEDCKGETSNGVIKTVVGEKARKRQEELEKLYGANIKNNFLRGDNKIKFLQFLDGVKPQSEIIQCEFTGKKVCLSLNYEYSHFKEMLSIVQLLKNRGCDYTLKATESDYFVAFTVIDSNGCEMNCSRLKYVNDANANGSSINVISLNNFWGILNVTEQDLLDMPFPEPSMFKCKKKSNSNPIRYNDSFSTTLGDVLRNQGIDLKKAY